VIIDRALPNDCNGEAEESSFRMYEVQQISGPPTSFHSRQKCRQAESEMSNILCYSHPRGDRSVFQDMLVYSEYSSANEAWGQDLAMEITAKV